jgi:hypothetical protein
VIVAVTSVHVVEVPRHEVVGVIAVGHRLVAAARAVDVGRVVDLARMSRGAVRGVLAADGERVFVDVIAVYVVEVAVVEEVLVTFVLDRGMPTAGSVNVRMVLVGLVLAHGSLALSLS